MHLRPRQAHTSCKRTEETHALPNPSSHGWLTPAAPPALPCRSDPVVTLLGCGWDGGDEAKMQQSFGWGKARFGAFQDVQKVAAGMGLPKGAGLASLARHVLGLELSKHKKVGTEMARQQRLGLGRHGSAAAQFLGGPGRRCAVRFFCPTQLACLLPQPALLARPNWLAFLIMPAVQLTNNVPPAAAVPCCCCADLALQLGGPAADAQADCVCCPGRVCGTPSTCSA